MLAICVTHLRVASANSRLPISILVDQEDATQLIPLIEKLKDYINNGIKYGRNRWAFQIHILNTDDTVELFDAG